MSLLLEIVKLSPIEKNNIDYDMVAFKIKAEKRIDIDSSRELNILFQTLNDGGARKILVDCHDLEYIDSSGIGAIIAAAKVMRKKGGDLIISSVTSDIMSIFKIVNLHEFIKIFNTDGEAMNHFRVIA